MDIVLGVSMAPTTVRMVLVEGENADGMTVDDEGFEVAAVDDSATSSMADQVIAAILGTRESAAEGDYRLASTGVVWTDPVEATALRDALAARKVENVMLVSAFMSAAALAHAAGSAVGYTHTGLLFLEPDTATLAVIESADGSIVDVWRQSMHVTDAPTVLAEMVAGLALETAPDGLFVVSSGVDITEIAPQLQTATALPISVPDEPETALARGAALASANAPPFTSSTSALAYAQVPDWTSAELVDPYAIVRGFADVSAVADSVSGALAYSVVQPEDDAYTAAADDLQGDETQPGRKPFVVALGVMMVFFAGVLALVVSLAVSGRPAVSQRPGSSGNLVVPAKQVPAPAPAPQSVPQPAPAVQAAPAPAPEAPVPAPAPEAPAPAPVAPAPAPVAPAPAPVHVAPKPVPVPAAAIPAPVAPAPAAEPPAAVAPAPVAPALAPAPAAPAPAPVAPAPVPAAVAPAPVAPVRIPIPILMPVAPQPLFPVVPPPISNPPVQSSPLQPGGGSGWPTRGGGSGWPTGGGNRGTGPGGLGGGGFGVPRGSGGGGFGGGHGGFGGGGDFGGGHGGGR